MTDFTVKPPPFFQSRIAIVYFTLFLPMGLYLPFFPLWLDYLQLSEAQIGWVVGLPLILRVFTTPFLTSLADGAKDRVHILIIISIAAIVLAALHFLPLNFWSVLALSLALTIVWAPQIPIADSIAVSGVRRYQSNYPFMRVWGSISFLAMNLLAGLLIERYTASAFPWLLLASYLAVFGWAVFGAPRIGQKRELGKEALTLEEKKQFLMARPFVLTLIAVACAQGSHAFLYTFGTIEWQKIGFSGGTIGALWSFSVLIEVLVFYAFARLLKHISVMKLMVVTGLVGMVRWGLMANGAWFDHALWVYFMLQSLHAFTFAISYLVLQNVIARSIPEELTGAAQGLSYFALGATLGLGSIASGPLYNAYGSFGFIAMGALCLCCIIAAILNLSQR